MQYLFKSRPSSLYFWSYRPKCKGLLVPLHLVPLTMLGCFNPILGKIWTKMAVFILPKIGLKQPSIF